jgi:toxin ParE1/3/4
MARIELVAEVFDDFDRFFDHLTQFETHDMPERIDEIVQALQTLSHSPLIGRPAEAGMHELMIGQGARGCVALYRFVRDLDTVFILAIRSQQESGHPRGRSLGVVGMRPAMRRRAALARHR